MKIQIVDCEGVFFSERFIGVTTCLCGSDDDGAKTIDSQCIAADGGNIRVARWPSDG